MACVEYLLRSVVLLLVASNLVCAESREDKLEDIILSSVQSIAALNELVTDLAVQVARVTVSLSELKVTVAETKQSIIEQTRGEMEEEVAALTTSLAQTNIKIDEEVAALTSSVAQTNDKIEDIQEGNEGELMIVSGEAAGNEKCMKVCAGTTGRSKTDWTDHGSDGIVYDVDISACDFFRVPTITTSIEGLGGGGMWKALGTASIYNASPSSFRMYLNHIIGDVQDLAEDNNWNIDWIAVGSTC